MADRVLVMHEGRLTGELTPRGGRRGARRSAPPRARPRERGGMSVERRTVAAPAEGARARRLTEWVFRVRELGIVVALAAPDPRHRDPRAALRRGRLAAQPRAQRLDLRDPGRGPDARDHHPQRRPLRRLRARPHRLHGRRPALHNPGLPLPVVFVLGMALGAACGLFNGVLVTWGQVPGARGHARHAVRLPRPRVPVDGRPPGQRRDAARRLPEPRHGLDRSACRSSCSSRSSCILVVGQWLRDYRAGRELYAIGSNPEGARLAGVRSDRRVLTAFVLAGALAGLGGVLFTARFGTVDATAGTATS